MELSDLKGIGPKRLELLHELNIRTLDELVRFFPREYLDYTQIDPIASLCDGQRASIRVTVLSAPTIYYHGGRYIVSARVGDGSQKATLRWMNQPYRMQQIKEGDVLYASGVVNKKRGTVLYNPQIGKSEQGIVPVYPSVKGLTQSVIRDAIQEALTFVPLSEWLPEAWLDRYGLIGYADAMHELHRPVSTERLKQAKRRISFEETFCYFTAIRSAKADRGRQNGFSFRTEGVKEELLCKLPFRPTDAQLRVMDEIARDMQSLAPMNRLVQGDVGSGKTLVAQFALSVAVKNGRQGVLLAPTELLAEQHFKTLSTAFSNAVLYTGGMKEREKREARERIASGDASLIVGTHALFSDAVAFSDLGLVVTDEQHRFGVVQRARIEAKGVRPDVLVMSATPIPRTLALLLYADLDLSVIDELPKGRKPVKTRFVPAEKRKALYRHLSDCAKKGERAYVVCPLIEKTDGYDGLSLEELSKELTALLPDVKIGILHGQLKDGEKHAVMQAFRTGSVSILLSTTVVEVGVDVPEATAMVIEGADHFGLATLHQLRGRVGRSDLQSYCYLLCAHPSELAKSRIQAMLDFSDGFLIAQHDLEMRGMGDLFGVRQSGEGELGSVLEGASVEIIETASLAAEEVMSLPDAIHNALLERAAERFGRFHEIARN